MTEFSEQISANGRFVKNLQAALDAIAYQSSETSPDIGLPKHALCLMQIHALEVILYWLQIQSNEHCNAAQKNRDRLIRFTLCWHLTVLDAPKASMECFKELKMLTGSSNVMEFPEKQLMAMLASKELALPIYSPSELEKIVTLPIRLSKDEKDLLQPVFLTQSDKVTGLRGWRRFVADVDGALEEAERTRRQKAVKLYERWWNLRGGYSHTLLLWLQRVYVFRQFEEKSAQPGMEDETPYDFDHICPQSHWYGWTGIPQGNRLIDFPAEDKKKISGADEQGYWRLGNAIGNVRVWDSSDNRGDGDASPSKKLKLIPFAETDQIVVTNDLLRDSVISSDETQAWISCSSDTDSKSHWTEKRAENFQKAIELRTFNLYQRFYADLKFGE